MTSERRFPTLTHLWVAAVFLVVVVRALVWPISPNDFWWQLATGRLIVETGAIPTADVFSYTQFGQPYYDQPWLSQVAMYALFRIGGPALALLVLAAILSLTYGLLLRLCVVRSGHAKLGAALVLLTLPTAMTNWSLRSQIFALPLFVAYLIILTEWRLGPGDGARGAAASELDASGRRLPGHRLWLLPPLMILWVNLHGSFVLGGLLVALTFLGVWVQSLAARRRAAAPSADTRPEATPAPPPRPVQLLGWGAVTAAALLVNPRGPGVLAYVSNLTGNPAIQGLIKEWMPPTTQTITGVAFFALATVVALVAAFARRRPDAVDALLVAAFFWLALSGERHVIWFALVAAPPLVVGAASMPSISARLRTEAEGRRSFNVTLLSLFVAVALLFLPWIKPHLDLPPDIRPLLAPETPVRAVRVLRADEDAPKRLFHSEAFGSYLMWAAPERKVFVDVRVELYPYGQLRDYQLLSAGFRPDSLLAQYDIDGLLLDNESQAGLLSWAMRSPDWTVRFRDARSSYLVRVTEEGR